MALPIITAELAGRYHRAEVEFSASRFRGLANAAGNPFGVEIKRVNQLGAFRMNAANAPIPNLVMGVTTGAEQALDAVLDWFNSSAQTCSVNINPLLADEGLLRHLAERRLYVSDFITVFYGLPHADFHAPADVEVRTFQGEAIGEFAEQLMTVDEVTEADRAFWAQARAAEFAEWRGYIAFVNRAPAARGAMAMRDGLATLGFARTNPRYRRRGCQLALLKRRFQDAASAGCELVFGGAPVNTTSERNQQRAGMRVAWTRLNWTQMPVFNQ